MPDSVRAFASDPDGFKELNDTHGHAVGDQVLTQVAGRIREVIREVDTPARYGGDEFRVLCEQVRSEEEATETAGASWRVAQAR